MAYVVNEVKDGYAWVLDTKDGSIERFTVSDLLEITGNGISIMGVYGGTVSEVRFPGELLTLGSCAKYKLAGLLDVERGVWKGKHTLYVPISDYGLPARVLDVGGLVYVIDVPTNIHFGGTSVYYACKESLTIREVSWTRKGVAGVSIAPWLAPLCEEILSAYDKKRVSYVISRMFQEGVYVIRDYIFTESCVDGALPDGFRNKAMLRLDVFYRYARECIEKNRRVREWRKAGAVVGDGLSLQERAYIKNYGDKRMSYIVKKGDALFNFVANCINLDLREYWEEFGGV